MSAEERYASRSVDASDRMVAAEIAGIRAQADRDDATADYMDEIGGFDQRKEYMRRIAAMRRALADLLEEEADESG